MAISNYTELKASIASWLFNRTDLAAAIPDYITLAEAQINRRLRVRQMVTNNQAISISSEYVAAPADHLEPLRFSFLVGTETRRLNYISPERVNEFKAGVTGTGAPQSYTLVGSQFQFVPAPDQTYTGEFTYYATIPALSDGNPTNWLLTKYPDAYLYGALLQAAPYLADDDRVTMWSGFFESILDDIEKSNRVPGGKLRTGLVEYLGSSSFNINTGV